MRQPYLNRSGDFRPIRRQRDNGQFAKKLLSLLAKGFFPVCMIAAFVGLCYFFAFSKNFSIDRVDVQASEGVDISQVKSIIYAEMDNNRFFVAPEKNIFLFNDASAASQLRALYAVDELVIQKKMPNKLVVILQARPLQIQWFSQDRLYDVDGQGMVIREALPGQSISLAREVLKNRNVSDALRKKIESNTPIIIDEENKEVVISMRVASDAFVDTIIRARQGFGRIGVQPLIFRAKQESTTLTVWTQDSWDAYITTEEPLERQLRSIHVLLSEKIRDKRANLRYIDARFGNRVYFTYK